MMHQLKSASVRQHDLLNIYLRLSVIRPILEYTCPAWSAILRNYLSNSIETMRGEM